MTYNSYSSNYKIATIKGEQSSVNYNTSYYWFTKGKQRIEQAANADNTLELLTDRLSVNVNVKQTLSELCNFFMDFIRQKKTLQKQFRKKRATIVLMIEKMKAYADVISICNFFGISERTYYNWKNKPICKISFTKECPNSVNNQLSFTERKLLEVNYFFNERYANLNVSELYAQTLADKKVLVSESLFYELARFLGEITKRQSRKKVKPKIGIRSQTPFEILHLDKTKLNIKGVVKKRVWLSLICDNHSRAIIGHHVSLSSKSSETLFNLTHTIQKYQLQQKTFTLYTDDGSENKGDVKHYLNSMPHIKHHIAQVTIDFSNSMIESVIKQLKYRYLKTDEFESFEHLIECVNQAIVLYNNRPRKIHFGKTPLQILNGDEQCKIELKDLMLKLREKRIEENREFKCLKHMY